MRILSFEEFENNLDKKFKFIILDGEKWYMGVHLKNKKKLGGLPLKMAYSSYLDWANKK